MKASPSLFQIFVSFTKIGAVLFGGGYAMLPLLEREVVTRRAWCTMEEMMDYYAMAQLVPGVIAVNTSMLVGQRLRGAMGTVVATFGVILAPFLSILAYAVVFDRFSGTHILQNAMGGLRPAVAGMLLGVSYTMFNRSRKTSLGLIVSLTVIGLVLVGGVSDVDVILLGVTGGLLWWACSLFRAHRAQKKITEKKTEEKKS